MNEIFGRRRGTLGLHLSKKRKESFKQRKQVPQFGNWESEESALYTEYFDNARKVRKDGMMNPNDSKDNPDMVVNTKSSVEATIGQHVEPKSQKEPQVAESKHDQHGVGEKSRDSKSESEPSKAPDVSRHRVEQLLSREEGDVRRQTDSTMHHDAVGGRGTFDSPHHRHGSSSAGGAPRRGTRQSGPDRNIEHSPIHAHYQARIGGKGSGVSSPSWERKGSSDIVYGQGSSTPGRSRLKSVTRGSEAPDESPAVPKFGDWDENDPAAAEGYTHIFNKVREERQVGAGKVPILPTETSVSNGQKRHGNDGAKCCCCFSWGRK